VEFNASGIGSSTHVRYLEAHDFYKKLLIEGLANPKLHRIVVDLINQWNTMVFPQAEFEIVPDSQAPSADEGSTSNPKNPDVADVLQLLSRETTEDSGTRPEMLSDADDSDWPQNGNDNDYDIYVNHDSTWVHPHSLLNLPLTPSTSANLATSARALSTTISTNISTMSESPTDNSPDPLPQPAPKKPTHTSNRRTTQPQPTIPGTDGPSEVCLRPLITRFSGHELI